jgi:hypothetical protein
MGDIALYDQRDTDIKNNNNNYNSYKVNKSKTEQNDIQNMKRNKRILIVDDEPFNILGLQIVL